MGKILLACFGLMVLLSLVTALLKALSLLAGLLIGLALLAVLFRVRPIAATAVCIVAVAAFVPKVVWPWVGSALAVWLVLEGASSMLRRFRRPKALRLPSS